jgi:hypothetical protein
MNKYEEALERLSSQTVYLKFVSQRESEFNKELYDNDLALLRELASRENPKKPYLRLFTDFPDCEGKINQYERLVCPYCGEAEYLSYYYFDDWDNRDVEVEYDRCHKCGQKLDWSEDEL